MIRDRGIVLEICPTSNLNTKVVSGWDEFRWIFDTFRRNEVRFTINTDGPEMLKTYIRDELAQLGRLGILSVDDQEQAAATSLAASFVPNVSDVPAPASNRLHASPWSAKRPRSPRGNAVRARSRLRVMPSSFTRSLVIIAAMLLLAACVRPGPISLTVGSISLSSGDGPRPSPPSTRAIAADRGRPVAYRARGEARAAQDRTDDFAKAIPDYDLAIELYPTDAVAYAHPGRRERKDRRG